MKIGQPKLLIIHHGALGDVVTTFPAAVRLRPSFRGIDALFQGKLGKLAAELKVVDGWFGLEAASFASLYFEPVEPGIKRLLGSYDSIVLLSGSRQLQKTINQITEANVHRIPPRPDVDQNIHVARHIVANLVKSGLIEDAGRQRDSILCSSVYHDKRDAGYDPAKVFVHPGSGSSRKNWGIKNYLSSAGALESEGLQTEFILGPAEHFMLATLQAEWGNKRGINVVDDLSELVLLLKTAGGFIGNDSGITHIAAFLGLPTVAVFGPSDTQRWKPVGRAVKALRPDLDCSPCFETSSTNCDSEECLHYTTPEMVTDSFYALAGKRG